MVVVGAGEVVGTADETDVEDDPGGAGEGAFVHPATTTAASTTSLSGRTTCPSMPHAQVHPV
ncbi:hypothetical protein JCM33774_66270 [Actinophytocola sp. KF-1]